MPKRQAVRGRTLYHLCLLPLLLGAAALGQSRVRIVAISFVFHHVQVQKPSATPRWQQARRAGG